MPARNVPGPAANALDVVLLLVEVVDDHRPDLVGLWFRITERIDGSLNIFL